MNEYEDENEKFLCNDTTKSLILMGLLLLVQFNF